MAHQHITDTNDPFNRAQGPEVYDDDITVDCAHAQQEGLHEVTRHLLASIEPEPSWSSVAKCSRIFALMSRVNARQRREEGKEGATTDVFCFFFFILLLRTTCISLVCELVAVGWGMSS